MSPHPPGPAPDVISAGPQTPPGRHAARAATGLLAAALAAAVLAAVHYHSQVAALRATAAHAHPRASAVTLSAAIATLPPAGSLAGQVTAVTAATSGQAQVIVTARLTGARPRTRYQLSGGDCTSDTATITWATGTTRADGTADLTGHAQAISLSHRYFLVLGAPGLYHNHPGPAVHGLFTTIGLAPVHGDVAPCIPMAPTGPARPQPGDEAGHHPASRRFSRAGDSSSGSCGRCFATSSATAASLR